MQLKDKLLHSTLSISIDKALRYIDKNPDENLIKLVDKSEFFAGRIFPKGNFQKFREALSDPDNVWRKYALSFVTDIDRDYIKKMLLSFGVGAGLHGTKTVRENREKYKCNIPWLMLLDPTSACNMKCKGCWSSEYGHLQSLSYEEMENIVSQGLDMGTHLYMFTGGEPLIRKDDILKLCHAFPTCTFLAYTNSTLIDEKFCLDMKNAGNLTLALSIEGSKDSNDYRRGEGSYDTAMKAMELLQKHRCLFGLSVCYTSKNIEAVTSDEFLDLMISKGVKFALYFNYMPIGSGADTELIPTPAQRIEMYKWLRKVRNSKTGKPLFVMDFQNDAEYVGGCVAGGRNYFHINSAGDIEPCVFIHYSDSNVRTHTLLEALKRPLLTAYYHNQPFNDNHLRPCPMLENPDILREIVNQTGAKSTDLIAPEPVEALCSRCDKYAAAWKPEAEKLWNSTSHPNPKTQFYRDTPEGIEQMQENQKSS